MCKCPAQMATEREGIMEGGRTRQHVERERGESNEGGCSTGEIREDTIAMVCTKNAARNKQKQPSGTENTFFR